MEITGQLVDYCSHIRAVTIPEEAKDAAKVQILDCMGVGLAGNRAAGIPELVKINAGWSGKRESSVIGYDLCLPAPHAAQVNASMIHACDFDDVHSTALMHPGVIAVPAALAVAQMAGAVTGEDFLAAVVMGTDLVCRLGMAVQSDVPKSVTGWHFTSIFGFPASAAVAGNILRLSPNQMHNALGIAYHQSAGNGQCALDGALTKRLGPGFAVRGGIMASLLAAEGVTGAAGWLEGEAGLYRQYFKYPCDDSVLLSELGNYFEGINVGIKRYPCCGIVHPFIDAALELFDSGGFEAEDIKEVKVSHGEGTRIVIEPIDAKKQPRNIVDSQFSVAWGVAAALCQGKVVLNNFTEQGIADEQTRNLARRIVAELDQSMTRTSSLESGRVELMLADGRRLAATTENRMNDGGGRISFDDCAAKFYECAESSGLGYAREKLNRIVTLIYEIGTLPDVSVIASLMQPCYADLDTDQK